MNIEIVQVGTQHFEIKLERLGLVGHIFGNKGKPFRVVYIGRWAEMTHPEYHSVREVVTPKVKLLNITRRLTQ